MWVFSKRVSYSGDAVSTFFEAVGGMYMFRHILFELLSIIWSYVIKMYDLGTWILVVFSYCLVYGVFLFSIVGSIYLVYKKLLPDIINVFKSKVEKM